MAHILNGDMVTLTLIQWVMNTFVVLLANLAARFVAGAIAKDNETVGYFTYQLIYIVFQILFGFLAMFVIMWFSRIREYRADIGGAQYTSRSSMVAWLKKLQNITKLDTKSSMDKKMTAFMINEPDGLFSTHPSLDNRIKALEENYQLV